MNYKCLIKRYTNPEKIKEGFYIRIREKHELLIYYNGFKILENLEIKEINQKKDRLEIPASIFMPNTKNTKINNEISDVYKTIPINVEKALKEIFSSGFHFTFGTKNYIKVEFISEEKDKKAIAKYYQDNFGKYFDIIEKENCIHLNKTERFSCDAKNYKEYQRIYKVLFALVKIGFSKKNDGNKYSKQPELEAKLFCDLDKISEENLTKLEEALKERTKNYANINREMHPSIDYIGVKSEDNQEKQVQQDLMLKENYQKLSFLPETVLPLEMEYNMYAEEEKKKKRNTIRGRIDNMYFDVPSKKVYLVEIKYNTEVIRGTNGIHKHLVDYNTCIKYNKNLKAEFEKIINFRNQEMDSKLFKGTFNCEKIEYYIVCAYSGEEKKILAKIDECKMNSAKVEAKIDNSKCASNGTSEKYETKLVEKNIIELLQIINTHIYTILKENGYKNCKDKTERIKKE